MSEQTLVQPSPVALAAPAAPVNFGGLTSNQVQERAAAGLQNKSSGARSKQITEILAENLFSVFNLIVAAIIGGLLFFYFRTGDARLPLDAAGVLAVALLNTALAVF